MRTVTIYIIINLLTFSLSANKPFNKYNFSNGDYKLYFCFQANNEYLIPEFRKTPEIKLQYGEFYITDKKSLEFILQDAILDKVIVSNPLNSFYSLRLTNNGKVIANAILDIDNEEIVTRKGKYKFNLNGLTSCSSKFNKLNSFTVHCPTISCINKLTTYVNSRQGFVYYGVQGEINLFAEFNGKIDLMRLVNSNDFSLNHKRYKKTIEKDLKKFGKGQMFGLTYEGGDTLKISMLWDKDYTDKLPEKYRVIKPYSDSINYSITVYNVQKNDIVDFFAAIKEENYTIDEL